LTIANEDFRVSLGLVANLVLSRVCWNCL